MSCPDEMILKIFLAIPHPSAIQLRALALVCKGWKRITEDESIWERLFRDRYPNDTGQLPAHGSWKRTFFMRSCCIDRWPKRSEPNATPSVYPAVDELILVKIVAVQEMYLLCTMNHYEDREAVILFQDISGPLRRRMTLRPLSTGNEAVARVIRVDAEKGYVDLQSVVRRRSGTMREAVWLRRFNSQERLRRRLNKIAQEVWTPTLVFFEHFIWPLENSLQELRTNGKKGRMAKLLVTKDESGGVSLETLFATFPDDHRAALDAIDASLLGRLRDCVADLQRDERKRPVVHPRAAKVRKSRKVAKAESSADTATE